MKQENTNTFKWTINQPRVREELLGKRMGLKPEEVIREFIANSIDSGANLIEIEIFKTIIHGIEKLIIRDNGAGINEKTLQDVFSVVATEFKSNKGNYIGKYGCGRFSFFSIANSCKWITSSCDKRNQKKSRIEFEYNNTDNHKEEVPYKIIEVLDEITGTEATISGIFKEHFSVLSDVHHLASSLTSIFAFILLNNKVQVVLRLYEQQQIEDKLEYVETYCEELDFRKRILEDHNETVQFNSIPATIQHIIFDTDVKLESKSQIIFSCKGVSFKKELLDKISIPRRKYLALVNSEEFSDLISTSRDEKISGFDTKFQGFKKEVIEHCEEYVKSKIKELNIPFLQMIRDKSFYPERFKKHDLDILEQANKLIYDKTLILLDQKLKLTKESEKIQKLICGVVDKSLSDNNFLEFLSQITELNEKDINEFSEIFNELKFEKLSSLYGSTAGRLKFLKSFEALVYHPDHNKSVKERSQLQLILEKNLWLFREEFIFAVFDSRISTILDKHKSQNPDLENQISEESLKENGLNLVPDFFLSYRKYNDSSKQDNFLVIEIKRPVVRLNTKHVDQVKKYMRTLIDNEQFKNSTWQFILTSSYTTDDLQRDLRSDATFPLGNYYEERGATLKILTWSDLIKSKNQEFHFISNSIKKEYNYDIEHIKTKYPELIAS